MSGRKRIFQLLLGICLVGIIGCGPARPVYLTSKGQIDKHYINTATRIEYPDTYVETSQEVLGAIEPLSVANPNPERFEDLSLEESICIAMKNSKVIRTLSGVGFSSAGVQGVPQAVLSAPSSVATVYDVALVESDPRYGVEAALSAFDAQLRSTVGWQTQDRGALIPSQASNTDVGTFQTSLTKTAATGGTFYMTNGNNYYAGSENSTYPSPFWTTYLEGGFSQPLLQGRGVQFNRIAGPGAIAGFYNGVSIARINTDSTITDFEIATRNLVYDVEKAYWNLYYAYHYLESIRAGYVSADQTWRQIKQKYDLGAKEGTAIAEAQARNQYFIFRARAEQAQSNLFKTEATLRYIMGIAATDGRLFRPSSEPTVAPVRLDWNDIVVEALTRSPELRKQKWDVKSKELQLLASKNFLLPRLDLNAGYRWNGVGKDWIDSNSANSSAYGSLTSDGYGDWQAGLNLSVPIGFRKEHAAVRNAKLALARSQSLLQEQEIELSHQLADSVREVAQYYQLSQTGQQRRIAAEAEVFAATNSYDVGKTTIDQVLDAQRRLAEAETEFYNNVVQYNLSITELHRRKGSLLEYNNVYLAEGPWPNKAYADARELARKRDAGHYLNYGYTRPQVFSRGTYRQFQGIDMQSGDETFENNAVPQVPQTPIPQPQIAPPKSVIETQTMQMQSMGNQSIVPVGANVNQANVNQTPAPQRKGLLPPPQQLKQESQQARPSNPMSRQFSDAELKRRSAEQRAIGQVSYSQPREKEEPQVRFVVPAAPQQQNPKMRNGLVF